MKFENLPKKIPIFPLSKAIFFPKTILPLNIFEDRYIQLVNDAIKNNRVFGMTQPKRGKIIEKGTQKKPELYDVGCLGKIINFSETNDNRFLITLFGLCRFKIIQEDQSKKLYREFTVDYSNFENDLKNYNIKKPKTDMNKIMNKVKLYFKKKNYLLDWNILNKLDQEQLIDTICMVSPLSVEEKQKLLETKKVDEKLFILDEILNFNLESESEVKTIQ